MRSYAIGLYEKALPPALDWPAMLRCAGACGYDYVELSLDETEARLARLDWSAGERRALRRAMEETGVSVGSICLSAHRKYPLGDPDPAVRARSLAILEGALRLAEDLGVRTIQLAGYDVYYTPGTPETRRLFRENLDRAAALAARSGVTLGFETMETEFMNTVEKAMAYVRAVGSPWLGVYPDAGNLANAAAAYGTDPVADLEAGAGHLLALHLKPTRPGLFRNLYFDDPAQHVDFPAVIAAAWRLGVRRYVTELWHQDSPRWREHILTANRRMTALLDRAAELP